MKYLLFVGIIVFSSCSKESTSKTCYECKTYISSSQYFDVGCYTNSEWNNKSVADQTGNDLNKNTDCRKK